MDKLHSKAPVSPSSGYSFPPVGNDNPSMFNDGASHKPGYSNGVDSTSNGKLGKKGVYEEKGRSRLPLGYDVDIETQYLPKTGIQERFLKHRPVFKGTYSEYESIALPPNPELAEIYK